MQRKTENRGTKVTTYEMLTEELKFKVVTSKYPKYIQTSALIVKVDRHIDLTYVHTGFVYRVDEEYCKRVTKERVMAHHTAAVCTFYEQYLEKAKAYLEKVNADRLALRERRDAQVDAWAGSTAVTRSASDILRELNEPPQILHA